MSGPPQMTTPVNNSLGFDAPTRDYWLGANSRPATAIFYAALGLMFSGLVTASILDHTLQCYNHFAHSDPRTGLFAVALGCSIVIAVLVVEGLQIHNLSSHAFTKYLSVLVYNHTLSVTILLLNTLLSLGTFCYYSWRVFELAGRRFLILVLMFGSILGRYTYALFSWGLLTRPLSIIVESFMWTPDGSPGPFPVQMQGYLRVYGILDILHSLTLCLILLVLLYKSPTSLFNVEQRLFQRLSSLATDSMLPAALCAFVADVTTLCTLQQSLDHNRWIGIFQNLTGPMYFFCLLRTLVSRQSLNELLNAPHEKSMGRTTTSYTSSGVGSKLGNVHVSIGSRHPRQTTTVDPPIDQIEMSDIGERSGVDRGADRELRLSEQPQIISGFDGDFTVLPSFARVQDEWIERDNTEGRRGFGGDGSGGEGSSSVAVPHIRHPYHKMPAP